MTPARLLATALLAASASVAAAAAPALHLAVDHSSSTLIDKPTALALWSTIDTPKLTRLYPVPRWGFVSEVEGGFDDARVCIVTARAMIMPRSGKSLVFLPARTATAYGMQTGASEAQCRALAKAKLESAIGALRAALVPA